MNAESKPLGSNTISALPADRGPFRPFTSLWRSLAVDRWAVLLIPAVALYVVVWSALTVLKFYALHATVFDLGLEMQTLWNFAHPQGVAWTFYVESALELPFPFLLSPISLPQSYPLVLIVQSFALGTGAFAVYGISRNILTNPRAGFCLSLAYLLYFPLGGVNWFDFHAQAFFIPLFLWGFLSFLTRRYRLALVLLLLAAGTNYPYVLLVGLFAALTIFEAELRRAVFKTKPDSSEWKFALILLVASIAFFGYQLAYQSFVVGLSFSQNAQILAGSVPLGNRLEVLALVLVPMVFLPVFTPKWVAMLVPFGYLELRSAATPFNFPGIFQIQFTAIAIPFVLIGTAYGIRSLNRLLTRSVVANEDQSPRRQQIFRLVRRGGRTSSLAVTVLLVTAGCALVFQPYGPFNQCCGDSFGISSSTEVNWTYFGQYTHLVNLVPPSTPFVLFQNSMPSLLPRPLEYHGAPLVTGLENWVNITNYDAQTNRFPLDLVQGQTVLVPLSYAISDPNSRWYTIGTSVPMFSFFTTMYQSGYYGLVGEASGMTLLSRGYAGPLEYYEPLMATIPSTHLYPGTSTTASTGPYLSRSNLTGQTAWSGPGIALSPGTYRIGFSLMTSSAMFQNTVSLLVLGDRIDTHLASDSIYGGNFTGANVWNTFDVTIQLKTAYQDVQFMGIDAQWRGTLSIRAVSITEIAPPTTIYSGPKSVAPSAPVPGSG